MQYMTCQLEGLYTHVESHIEGTVKDSIVSLVIPMKNTKNWEPS